MSTSPPDQPDEPPAAPFDPYRFGAPEHPVPPEYAPPGYIPPASHPASAPVQPYAQPGYQNDPLRKYPPQDYPPQGHAPPGYQPPGYQPQGYPPPGYQQQGPPYGYQAPFGSQYPQPKPGNGKSIASLVLGIASIVLCWTTILDLVPVVLALIFGSLGLGEAKRGRGGRGQAIAGMICAGIGAVAAIALFAWFYSRIHPCMQNFSSGSSEFNSCVRSRL